jgi:hypothetical protein
MNGCRECHFYKESSNSGICDWFKEYNNEKEAKTIPETIIDKGCKFYITNKASHLIKVFEGRVIYE